MNTFRFRGNNVDTWSQSNRIYSNSNDSAWIAGANFVDENLPTAVRKRKLQLKYFFFVCSLQTNRPRRRNGVHHKLGISPFSGFF